LAQVVQVAVAVAELTVLTLYLAVLRQPAVAVVDLMSAPAVEAALVFPVVQVVARDLTKVMLPIPVVLEHLDKAMPVVELRFFTHQAVAVVQELSVVLVLTLQPIQQVMVVTV
jgi:hypothetical protein